MSLAVPPEQLAQQAEAIAEPFRASLVRDVMAQTSDWQQRLQLGAAVLTLVLRRFLRDVPYTERTRWLEEMVKAVLQ